MTLPTPEAFEALAQRCDLKGPFESWHKGAREDYMALATACRIAARAVDRDMLSLQIVGVTQSGAWSADNMADAIIAYLTDQTDGRP